MTFLPDNLCMMLALGRQRKQRTHVNRKRRVPCINLCASDVPASSNRGSFVSIHHSPHIYLCIVRRYKWRRASKPTYYVFTRQRRLRRFGLLTRETFTKGICCNLCAFLPTLYGSGDASLKFNVSLLHDVLVWCYLRNMFDVRWRMRFLNGFRAFWSIAAFLHSTDALIAFSLWRHWRFLRR
jgi:hypothetical protein